MCAQGRLCSAGNWRTQAACSARSVTPCPAAPCPRPWTALGFGPTATLAAAAPPQTLGDWAKLYIKYLQALRKLGEAHDAIVHPQKRRALALMLHACTGRVLEIHAWLVCLHACVMIFNCNLDLLTGMDRQVAGQSWPHVVPFLATPAPAAGCVASTVGAGPYEAEDQAEQPSRLVASAAGETQ